MNVVVHNSKRKLDESGSCVCISTVNYDLDSKSIIGFSVLFVFKKEGRSFEIIKYDTAHGQCHVHHYYEYLDHEGDLLLDNRICPESAREFKNDIKQNWQGYLQRYRHKHFKYKF